MKNVILTAFDGENSSSGLLIGKISADCTKLLLPCDKRKSAELLKAKIEETGAVCVIMTGQKPNVKEKIAVEASAMYSGEKLHTVMDCTTTVRLIRENGYNAYISKGSGNSLCNYLYAECLMAGINCIFLNIPTADRISDTDKLCTAVEGYINSLSNVPAMLVL